MNRIADYAPLSPGDRVEIVNPDLVRICEEGRTSLVGTVVEPSVTLEECRKLRGPSRLPIRIPDNPPPEAVWVIIRMDPSAGLPTGADMMFHRDTLRRVAHKNAGDAN